MCAEKLRNIKQHSRAAAEAAARRNQFSWLTRSPWTCGDLKWEREISELCDMRNKSLESAHRKYVSLKNMFACRQRKIWKPRMNFNLFFHYFQWLQIKDAVNNSHTSHENVLKSFLESLSHTLSHTKSKQIFAECTTLALIFIESLSGVAPFPTFHTSLLCFCFL